MYNNTSWKHIYYNTPTSACRCVITYMYNNTSWKHIYYNTPTSACRCVITYMYNNTWGTFKYQCLLRKLQNSKGSLSQF